MNDLKGLRVVVAGAGAVGSVAALTLLRRGARVTLADPAAGAANASGVAAGMLAPVCEALLDPASADHYPLLKAGRDGWEAVFQSAPRAPAIDRTGTIVKAAGIEALLVRAAAMGAALDPLTDAAARRLAPGLAADGPYLFTPEDWRLEPQAMLAALAEAFAAAGGERLAAAALGIEAGKVLLRGGGVIEADALVMATGPAGGGLTPIKGQILRFVGIGPAQGAVVRGEGVYAAPSAQGMIVGASMEEGSSDLAIDPLTVERLQAAAALLFPALAGARASASAGVRAAAADGLPLVGPGEGEGLFIARGARRNGWLLAPLMAEVIADRLAGRPLSAAARAFDPTRLR